MRYDEFQTLKNIDRIRTARNSPNSLIEISEENRVKTNNVKSRKFLDADDSLMV